MELCFSHRGEDMDHRYLDASGSANARIMLTCTIPLSEIMTDFFDKLKSRSSGFASFECVFPISVENGVVSVRLMSNFLVMKMLDTSVAKWLRYYISPQELARKLSVLLDDVPLKWKAGGRARAHCPSFCRARGWKSVGEEAP